MKLGIPPQPTAPWRPYIFRVHCVVTQRWMKIRVPFAWFWYGEAEYGNPEVESGTIASTNPTPPNVRRVPLANDGGQLREEDLVPYQTPAHRKKPETMAERLDRMEYELGQARSASDPRNSPTAHWHGM